MNSRTKMRLALLGIMLLTVLAGVVDYPKGPDIQVGSYFKEIKVHLGLDLQGGTSLLYNADVTEIEETERAGALDGVRDVIERRINAFGVGEPNIRTVRSGEDWRILVELPGVTDITEAVQKIGETPLLEFKTEGEPPEITEEEKEAIRERNKEKKKTANDLLAQLNDGADFEELAKEFSEDPGSQESGGDLGEFPEGAMVPKFNDAVFNGSAIGEIQPELVETSFGYHIIRVDDRREEEVAVEADDADIEETNDSMSGEHEADADEGEGEEIAENTEEEVPVMEVVKYASAHHILIQKESEDPPITGPNYVDTGLTGEQLDRADVTLDPNTGLPTVSLSFNKEGKKMFADITRENTGKTVAIYLDNEIISSPVVQQEITGGEAVISGNFTLEESRDLAQRLNAGALPVPIDLISQQNVGPTLGQESIERSLFAGIFGLVLLSIFMIAYYRLPGLLAVTSLMIYFMLVLAVFKLWPVTLTLAGIAGFILSIGMAVDANVLIFERFKEELRSGKPVSQSIDDGFKRAWSSIRDGNVSSLITCLILYWFGASIIRGFAITLAIGIVLSMFSAIVITKNLMALVRVKNYWWYGVGKNKQE